MANLLYHHFPQTAFGREEKLKIDRRNMHCLTKAQIPQKGKRQTVCAAFFVLNERVATSIGFNDQLKIAMGQYFARCYAIKRELPRHWNPLRFKRDTGTSAFRRELLLAAVMSYVTFCVNVNKNANRQNACEIP